MCLLDEIFYLTCFMGTIIVFVNDPYSVGRDTSTYKVKFSNLYLYVHVHMYHIPVYLLYTGI